MSFPVNAITIYKEAPFSLLLWARKKEKTIKGQGFLW